MTTAGEEDPTKDELLQKAPVLRESRLGRSYKYLAPCILNKKIGQGGMGSVYHALHLTFDSDVAVKCMTASSDPRRRVKAIDRFRREVRALATVSHQNIIRLFDAGEGHGLHWYVMEFVDGETLRQRTRRKQPMGIEEALTILTCATQGVAAAHAAGIIHRDIKPDNILVSRGGEVKVADLGLAKPLSGDAGITLPEVMMGTPAYMAPEQWKDASKVDERADIYALGATLYFMLAGRDPYWTESLAEAMQRTCKEPFPDIEAERIDVSDAVVRIIERCTRKEREERYSSALSLLQDLRAAGGLDSRLSDNRGLSEEMGDVGSLPPREVIEELRNEARKIDSKLNFENATTVRKSPRRRRSLRRILAGALLLAMLLAATHAMSNPEFRQWFHETVVVGERTKDSQPPSKKDDETRTPPAKHPDELAKEDKDAALLESRIVEGLRTTLAEMISCEAIAPIRIGGRQACWNVARLRATLPHEAVRGIRFVPSIGAARTVEGRESEQTFDLTAIASPLGERTFRVDVYFETGYENLSPRTSVEWIVDRADPAVDWNLRFENGRIEVTGTATDDLEVASVSILGPAGEPVSPSVEPDGRFSATLPAAPDKEGTLRVRVAAVDRFGRSSPSDPRDVFVDTRPPRIVNAAQTGAVYANQEEHIRVPFRIELQDASAVVVELSEGRSIAVGVDGLCQEVALVDVNDPIVRGSARDAFGNQTEIAVPIALRQVPRVVVDTPSREILEARLPVRGRVEATAGEVLEIWIRVRSDGSERSWNVSSVTTEEPFEQRVELEVGENEIEIGGHYSKDRLPLPTRTFLVNHRETDPRMLALSRWLELFPSVSEEQDEERRLPREVRLIVGSVAIPFVLVRPGVLRRRVGSQLEFEVRVGAPFYVAKFEVTHAVWNAARGLEAPDESQALLPRPIRKEEADELCRLLTERLPKPLPEGFHPITIAVPTIGEWEWAARGDLGGKYPWSSQEVTEEHGWFVIGGRRPIGPRPVGSFPMGASAFCGALDMSGNLRELTADDFAPDPSTYWSHYQRSGLHVPLSSRSTSSTAKGGDFQSYASDVRIEAPEKRIDFFNDSLGLRPVLRIVAKD